MVFSWWIPAIVAIIGIFACMVYRTFEKDHGHYISVEEIEETENKSRGAHA